jgi:hypothetical protein
LWKPLKEFRRDRDSDIEDTPVVDLIERLREAPYAELLYIVTSLGRPSLTTVPYESSRGLEPVIWLGYRHREFFVNYSPIPLPRYKQRREVTAWKRTKSLEEAASFVDLLMIRIQYELPGKDIKTNV